MDKVEFLDKGYVRLVDHMGSDLSIVNAARVSYQKTSENLSDADKRLIEFLAREQHTAPFRHAFATFEVYAPLMVARQWWKYVVGSDHVMEAWNEASRRYVTSEPEFYIVDEGSWRSMPPNMKQGSGGNLDPSVGSFFTSKLSEHYDECLRKYEDAMSEGICAEQARLFLPGYGTYVYWRWSASLHAICHFLTQRLDTHAQKEIQLGAQAVRTLIEPIFPVSVTSWLKHNVG